jgi:ADP-heptose:LPS heptosyltransferase
LRFEHKLVFDYYAGGTLHALLKPWVVLLGQLLRRDHDLSHCRDVTFLKLMGGGSLVIAYPALLALRRSPRISRLRLVTSPAVKPFAESLHVFDEIVVVDDRSLGRLAAGSIRTLARLFRASVIVDLEIHSRLTTVFSLLSCARNRIGFYTMDSFWRRELSTHLLFCNVSRGVYHFYDQIAGLFGAAVPDFPDCIAEFRRTLGWDSPREGPIEIGVAPCCSELGRERMFSAGTWAGILMERENTNPKPERIRLFGGMKERPYLESIRVALAARGSRLEVLNHGGEFPLLQSVRLLTGLAELQCVDSALLHYARLCGIRTVSYWGPTDPATRLRPWPGCRDTVYYAGLPCSPCVHLSYSSPCHGNNVCMGAAVASRAETLNPAWLAVPLPAREPKPAPLPVYPA